MFIKLFPSYLYVYLYILYNSIHACIYEYMHLYKYHVLARTDDDMHNRLRHRMQRYELDTYYEHYRY